MTYADKMATMWISRKAIAVILPYMKEVLAKGISVALNEVSQ